MWMQLSSASAGNGMNDENVRDLLLHGVLFEGVHQDTEHVSIGSAVVFTHRLEPLDRAQRTLNADLAVRYGLSARPTIRSITDRPFIDVSRPVFRSWTRWFEFLKAAEIKGFGHLSFLQEFPPLLRRTLGRSGSLYRFRRRPPG